MKQHWISLVLYSFCLGLMLTGLINHTPVLLLFVVLNEEWLIVFLIIFAISVLVESSCIISGRKTTR